MSAIMSSARAVSQSDIDLLETQKTDLEAEQERLTESIRQMQEEKSGVLEQKAALDEQNELTRQEIELIDRQIALYDQLVENKELELEEAQDNEQQQAERYRTRLRVMEEEGTVSFLAMLFQATSFSDLISRMDMIWEIMKRDSELEEQYIAAREQTERVKNEYEVILAEREATRSELTETKEQLESDIAGAEQLIEEIEENITEHESEYEENEEKRRELEDQIDLLIEQMEAERLLSQQAAAWAEANGEGMFIWPTTGYLISSGWGYRVHPIYGTTKLHTGIDISVDYGQPVYAAADGVVSASGYNESYGNFVMIDHGTGYYTLYAHMAALLVSTWEEVGQGQPIGYVGSTGWATGPHLHFEVRANGCTYDPLCFY